MSNATTGLNALREALSRLLSSHRQPLVEIEENRERLSTQAAGQVLRAQVVAQLPGGRSVVDIQGAPFEVKLPVPARTGDTLDLQVLTLEPGPTFALRSPPQPLVEIAGDTVRLPGRTVGELLQARVVAELPNGRSSIDIDGVRYDVKLPVQPRAGETLRLEVRALEPRVILTLVPSATDAARDSVAMSEPMRRLAAILDRITASSSDAARTPPQSPAAAGAWPLFATNGRATALPVATSLIAGTGQPSPTPASRDSATEPGAAASNVSPTMVATSVTPVISSAPLDAAALAEGLKRALTQSGVFYESHQAQWVMGQRGVEDVMREPQASLKPTGEPLHPQTLGIVRQQLEILDTRQLVWQGAVWPDQTMEWRLEEDRGARTAADDLPVWRTSLRLKLPRLGEVSATIAIQGDELRLAFTGLDPHARSVVSDSQIMLRDALAKAGLALLDMKVNRDER